MRLHIMNTAEYEYEPLSQSMASEIVSRSCNKHYNSCIPTVMNLN